MLSSANADEVTAPAATRFGSRDTKAVPDFQKHVIPLLGRLGCNSAKCHGSFQGQGGFRLSLFGFDFETDHAALLGAASSAEGPRLKTDSADESLVVLKPTEQVDHEGGERLAKRSWEHHLLLRWIKSGAHSTAKPQAIQRLEVQPSEIVFANEGDTRQLKVIAVWENGSREDVTCLCRFRTNDDAVVQIDAEGEALAAGRGDTHIVAFYDNGVAAIPVMRRWSTRISVATKKNTLEPELQPIDKFVADKLSKLGISPSNICTDAEFLRRVSIDMTGTLPAPDEIEAFLADDSAGKRLHKINKLLQRPAYAAWWANKLCDFTGCSPTAFGEQTNLEVGHAFATQWYDWIYRRVADNTPYDRLVEGIVLAESRTSDQSPAEYAAEMSAYVRREAPADFSTRKTMPHYWIRATVGEPKDKALAFAHSFLGIQLQCAECHKHPFDKWTQEDFSDFTRFFEDVKSRGRVGFPQFAAAQRGEIVGWPEMVLVRADEKKLRLLRSHDVTIYAGTDPRQPLMDWMQQKDNPWFARAFVNRVWAGYFHVGIVDPPDQFTPANPPSNPQLLDWLTEGFIESGYDMKWIHRQIASSETYQRSWKPNETNRHDRRNFSRAIPRRIPAEVVYDAMKQITAANDQLDEVRTNLKRRASGHLSMRMAGTHAMKVFGKPERAINCDCERVNEPTLLQAVFVHNDPLVRMRLADSGWIAEIAEAEREGTSVNAVTLIKQAWLRTVNRPPTEDEVARATQHVDTVDSLAEGMNDLLWAMLNTKEFLLNH
jgi:hypothetical protein